MNGAPGRTGSDWLGRSGGGAERPAPRRPPPRGRRLVLASVGPQIPGAVVDRLCDVSRQMRREGEPQPVVHVLSVARIWGTKMGFPNPGLYPNRVEMEEQQRIVETAASAVRRRGLHADTRIVAHRNASKAIAAFAERVAASAIVVGDPAHAFKPWERLLKGDEARAISRRTTIPVHVVPIDEALPRGMPTRHERTATRRRGRHPGK